MSDASLLSVAETAWHLIHGVVKGDWDKARDNWLRSVDNWRDQYIRELNAAVASLQDDLSIAERRLKTVQSEPSDHDTG